MTPPAFFKKKTLLFLLVLLLLVSSLTACVERVGTGSSDTTTVLKIDGFKVTMDEYRYLCCKYKALLDSGEFSVSPDAPEAEAALKEAVLRELCAVYAVHSLAKEYEVALADAHVEAINQEISDEIARLGGEDAYFAAMEPYHLTGDQVWREYTLDYLRELLFYHVIDERTGIIPSEDAVVEACIADGSFFCVRYFMVQDNTPDGSGKAACRDYAETLRSTLAQTNAFDTLTGTTLSDPANPEKTIAVITKCPDAYFIKGYMPQAAEAAILATQPGSYTDVVEIDGTFFVYQRREAVDATMRTTEFESLRQQYLQRAYSDLLSQRANELYGKIVFKRAYNTAFSIAQ